MTPLFANGYAMPAGGSAGWSFNRSDRPLVAAGLLV